MDKIVLIVFRKLFSHLFILAIFLLAASLRLIWLDRVPGAITGDEINYILPVKSFAISGEDLTFQWNIFKVLVFSYPTVLPQAELPYFLLYPATVFLPLSLFTTRITYALISAATVIPMFLLVSKLLGKRAGIIAAVLTAINPWQVFIGRTSYEFAATPFFYLLAIYFLIHEKGRRIFIALPIFFLAFYSYIGTKVVFIPLVFAASVFAYFQNKKRFAKECLILNVACILLVLFYAFVILGKTGASNRANEIATPLDPAIASQVDKFRKTSFAPDSLTNIFVNKLTVYSRIMLTKTLNSFSPNYLFIAGDNFTALYGHGLFYFIDALFLILGLGFILIRSGRVFALIGILILISTLPHVLHTLKIDVFTPHLALFMTLLIIPVSVGISEILSLFKTKALFAAVLIYTILTSNFLFVYFFQFPLWGHFDFPARIVARYVALASKNGAHVNVYANGTHDFYKKYIFYTDSFNRKNFDEIKNSTNSFIYRLGNVNFVPCGDIVKKFDASSVNIYQSGLCSPFEYKSSTSQNAKISRLDDGGEIYRIYNDTVCSKFNLKAYPSGLKISDFSVESLSPREFCEAFITR